jgi:hypothetical protein
MTLSFREIFQSWPGPGRVEMVAGASEEEAIVCDGWEMRGSQRQAGEGARKLGYQDVKETREGGGEMARTISR